MSVYPRGLEQYVAPTTKSIILSNQLPLMISGEQSQSVLGIGSYSVDNDSDYNDF